MYDGASYDSRHATVRVSLFPGWSSQQLSVDQTLSSCSHRSTHQHQTEKAAHTHQTKCWNGHYVPLPRFLVKIPETELQHSAYTSMKINLTHNPERASLYTHGPSQKVCVFPHLSLHTQSHTPHAVHWCCSDRLEAQIMLSCGQTQWSLASHLTPPE